MNEQVRAALLVSALVTLASMFGLEVGAFEERQRRAYSLALKVVRDVQSSLGEPSAPESGSGPES